MYFENKFNKEIQTLIKEQEWGGDTTLGAFDNEAFFKQSTVDINKKTSRPPFTKVIPLLLFNNLISNNEEDTCFEDKALICANTPNTVINCFYDNPYEQEEEGEE